MSGRHQGGGNAAAEANRTHATLTAQVTELLEQAAQADRAEDAHHGETPSDQLPRALAARAERLAHPSGLERLFADLDPSVRFAGDTLEVGGRGEGHRDLAGEGWC